MTGNNQVTIQEHISQLYKEKEAATVLGIKPGTLRKWRWEGNKGPKFFKIGSSVRYSIEDLQNYIAKARRQNTSEIFTGKEG